MSNHSHWYNISILAGVDLSIKYFQEQHSRQGKCGRIWGSGQLFLSWRVKRSGWATEWGTPRQKASRKEEGSRGGGKVETSLTRDRLDAELKGEAGAPGVYPDLGPQWPSRLNQKVLNANQGGQRRKLQADIQRQDWEEERAFQEKHPASRVYEDRLEKLPRSQPAWLMWKSSWVNHYHSKLEIFLHTTDGWFWVHGHYKEVRENTLSKAPEVIHWRSLTCSHSWATQK